MSSYRALRSLGHPYFGLVQGRLDFMHAFPADVFAGWTVRAALHSLPVRNASDTELHALASLHTWGPGAAVDELLAIGITPQGAIKVIMPGATAVSPPGHVTPGPAFRYYSILYETGGTYVVALDGVTVPLTVTGVPGGPISGQLNEVALLMDKAGVTRMDASISYALFMGFPTLLGSVAWVFNESQGLNAAAVMSSGNPGADLTLVAQFYQSYLGQPWGPPTETDPYQAFRREIYTDYTPRPLPTTAYTLKG